MEIKKATKDKLVYSAMERYESVKEIHIRRASCGDDMIIVREYIPPQFWDRFKAIGRKASEKRADNPNLKTQIRWGEKDLEIYTKLKGRNEQMTRTSLKEFMEDSSLPDFDFRIKWQQRFETRDRRQPDFRKVRNGPPSLEEDTAITDHRKNLRRQRSTNSNNETTKKSRNSNSQTEDMDDYESPASRNEEDVDVEEEDEEEEL